MSRATTTLATAPAGRPAVDCAAGLRSFAGAGMLTREQMLGAPVHWSRPSRLSESLKATTRRMESALRTLALHTVGDLLEHLPRDTGETRRLAELEVGEPATVVVTVRSISVRSVRRRGMRPLTEAIVDDDSGSTHAIFFNQPWLVKRYSPGVSLLLSGRLDARGRFAVSGHAAIDDTERESAGLEGADGAIVAGRVARYAVTEGLSTMQLLSLVRRHRHALGDVPEPLPGRLRARERLSTRAAALAAMHFPQAGRAGESVRTCARGRLVFDELLLDQIELVGSRERRRLQSVAPGLTGPHTLTERWLADCLPFELTADQQRAIETVDGDLRRGHQMQRLLMGEVGSGKTVVALHAMLRAVECGWQAALMAPTETLAEQHIVTVRRLLGDHDTIGAQSELLTGSTPPRRRARILGMLGSGELPLVVGTHALIGDEVRFARLGVVVVDEQHRFGVRQRAALDRKAPPGLGPHVLHMTATPIPRTLALSEHADLDHTALRELPHGRRPVRTYVVEGDRERRRAYDRIREELRAGRQAFVVCPLVEESQSLQVRAATVEYERLRDGELEDFRVVLLHGQMGSREKQRSMAAFVDGEADVLVSTSVVEVGIDVSNATVMLIEDADRYGLAQLHQMRGRVGRGEHDSLCLLFGPKRSRRLRALQSHSDGFELAQIDLELRGQGDLVGVRQHGDSYRLARFPQDAPLLERAHACACALLEQDPNLEMPEHAPLRDALEHARQRAFGVGAPQAIPA